MKKSNFAWGVALCLVCSGPGFADPPNVKKVPNTVVQMPLTGKIVVVDLKKKEIIVESEFQKVVTVVVDSHIQILKDGKPVTLKQLNPKDRVVVMTRK